MLNILSLGAGVQSSAVLLMSCKGHLPKLDAAIFADTGWEPKAVYKQLEFLKVEACNAGIPLYVVNNGNIKEDALSSMVRGVVKDSKSAGKDNKRRVSIPYFTKNEDGSVGMLQRQCTSEYKIKPVLKKIRELIGLKPRQHGPKEVVVELWMGISMDEVSRVRDSRQKWIKNYYPLIETLGLNRTGCLMWLKDNGYPEPSRSACIACPFHNNHEWRFMKKHKPDEWKDAVEFDKAIRRFGGVRGDIFVHRSAKPLEEVDLRNDRDRGQMYLWDLECEGMCGI